MTGAPKTVSPEYFVSVLGNPWRRFRVAWDVRKHPQEQLERLKAKGLKPATPKRMVQRFRTAALQHPEYGLKRALTDLLLAPANPFENNTRRWPKPVVVYLLSIVVSTIAWVGRCLQFF